MKSGDARSGKARSKTTYRPFARLDHFYTGGSVCLDAAEGAAACPCGDEVKVRRAAPEIAVAIALAYISARGSCMRTVYSSLVLIFLLCRSVFRLLILHRTLSQAMYITCVALLPALRAQLHACTFRIAPTAVRHVQIVELASGAVTHTFAGDAEPITALAVSPNGKHLFTSSRSLASKAWDLQSGACFRTWRVRKHPCCCIHRSL